MERKKSGGFVRVTLLRFESSARTVPRPIPSESFVSVKIKDAEPTATGVALVQHRRTATHQWNSFFDSHIYNGRVVQMIVKRNPDQMIAETTIGIPLLRKHCVPSADNNAPCEVSPEVSLPLNPGGNLFVKIRFFPGSSSTSSTSSCTSSVSSNSDELLPPFRARPGGEAFDRLPALPDPIEPESSESDDEIYGVAMRRYAIRHQKVVEVKGHKFIETFFKLPAVCSYCSEFLWGLSKPGLKCQDCSCAVHKKCHEKILTVCPGSARNSVETQMMTERFHINVPHRFVEYNYMTPTFCEQCGTMLYGLFRQGLKCTECGVNCHKKCEHHMANLCGVNKKILIELQETLQTIAGKDCKNPQQKQTSSKPVNGSPVSDSDDDDSDEYADVYEALADNAKRICISPIQSPLPVDTKRIGFIEAERAPPIPTRDKLARAGIISIYSTSDTEEENYENVPRKPSVKPLKVYTLDDFKLHKVLGRGAFGKVLLVEQNISKEFYAVKALKKDVVLEYNDVECTLLERRILEMGRQNPYITKLFCTFQTPSHLFIVMEYLTGGDLMYHIQHDKKFTNERAQFYAAEIICGLQFLHSNGIIYRDLKPDNILLDKEGHVKIADFGMCKDKIIGDNKTSTFCGTPHYIAPEIINGSHYNSSVDWFSLGVVLFEMLVGKLPFDGDDEDDVFRSIQTMTPRFPKFLKSDAQSCLQLLLEKRPHARLGTITCTAGPIRDHVYFRNINWTAIEQRRVEPSFKPKIKSAGDVRYFEAEFTREPAKLTVTSKHLLSTIDQSVFTDFDYTNPDINASNTEPGIVHNNSFAKTKPLLRVPPKYK